MDLFDELIKNFGHIHIDLCVKRMDGEFKVRQTYSLEDNGTTYESPWKGYDTDEELKAALIKVIEDKNREELR